MPSLSGEIFTLGADAGFEEGFVEGRVGGQAGATLALDAEVCHGINLRADIELKGEIEGRFRVLLPYIRGQGQLFASAGVAGQLAVNPNLFETFGLTVNVEAAAEASVAGQLAIGLDAQVLADYGQQHMSGLALKLFMAFLREVSIEAGVWGKASFSAMARAHLEVNGSILGEDDASFTIQAGYAAGLKGGTGWDFFCGVNFDSIRRFYVVAVDLITKDIAAAVRRELPEHLKPGTELIELLLPVSLHTAYDVGQRSVMGSITSPKQLVTPFLTAWAECLQRYLVDKANQLADRLMSELIDSVLIAVFDDQLTDQDRDAVEQSVRDLIELFRDGELDIERVPDAIGHIIDIADVLGQERIDQWQRPIALLWTAMAIGHSLRDIGRATAGIGGSVLGFGAHVRAEFRPMPAVTPQMVIKEYRETIATFDENLVDFGTAIDYLAEVGLEPMLKAYVPELSNMLELLSELFDLTPGDVVRDGLKGATGESLADLELYRKLKAFVREKIEQIILGELFPAIEGRFEEQSDVQLYMNDVAKPSFRLISDFLFDRMDVVVTDLSSIDQHPFLESTAKAVSMVMFNILARNLVVAEYIVSREVFKHTSHAMGQLAQHVTSDPTHVMVRSAREHIAGHIPGIPNISDPQIDALQEFLQALLLAGQESFGPGIMTIERQERLRELKKRSLLSIAGDVDWSLEGNLFRTTFKNFLSCSYIPDPEAIRDMALLQIDILSEQMEVVLRRVPPALSRLVLTLTEPSIQEIENRVRMLIGDFQKRLDDALEFLVKLGEQLNEALALAEEALQIWSGRLDALATQLNDPALVDVIMTDIKDTGEANLRQHAVSSGFSDNTADLFAATFVDVTWPVAGLLIRPLVATALSVMGIATGALADAMEQSTTTAEASQHLNTQLRETLIGPHPPAAFSVQVDIIGIGTLSALTPEAVFNTAWDAIKSKIEDHFGSAIADRLEQLAQLAKADDLEQQQTEQQEMIQQYQMDLQDASAGPPPRIRIFSPGPLAGGHKRDWVYGDEVSLYLRLLNGKPSYVHHGPSNRIRLTLNGQPLSYQTTEWSYQSETRALELRKVLTESNSALTSGVNILEFSVSDGAHDPVRETVVFLADMSMSSKSDFTISPELSQFDAPGSDHAHALDEFVAITYIGQTPASMQGWRIQDRGAKHAYDFPDVTFQPHTTIRLITGGEASMNSATELYWGRRSAVWNNVGDCVYLIDPDNILRAELNF